MKIGVLKEVKDKEERVALSPVGVKELVEDGNVVYVEEGAGVGVGFLDSDYQKSGAKVFSKKEMFENSDLIVKVKEPQAQEVELFRENQILFSYLHLAAEEELTRNLLKKNIIAISFETVRNESGALPLLIPMSAIAGKLSVQNGVFAMQKNNGGPGILIGGVGKVSPAKTVILGGGVVGENAALIASGMGAETVIVEKSEKRIEDLKKIFGSKARVIASNDQNIKNEIKDADLVVGAVLIPGAKSPNIIKKEDLKLMKKGAVIVDVSIDQGGCFETSRPTTHSNPTYEVDGVIHYCVTNIPAAVAKTASKALELDILPYVKMLAQKGLEQSFKENRGFLEGLNIYKNFLTIESVASNFNLDYKNSKDIF